MNTKIQLKKKHSIAQLEHAIKSSQDEAQKTRLRAMIKIKNGATKTAVAKDFCVGRLAIISWVKAYNNNGIDGLTMSKGGRPEGNPVWDKKIFTALTKEIDKQKHCWSLPLMREWIKKHKKKDIPEQTIWYHLKLLEYSYKSLRPHPYKGEKEVQEVFKKKAYKS